MLGLYTRVFFAAQKKSMVNFSINIAKRKFTVPCPQFGFKSINWKSVGIRAALSALTYSGLECQLQGVSRKWGNQITYVLCIQTKPKF